MNARPGTFCLIPVFILSSEKFVQPTAPPIDVTELLPIRTRLLAPETAKLPIAVELVKAPSPISAP
jgi:hypothetical protein